MNRQQVFQGALIQAQRDYVGTISPLEENELGKNLIGQ